MSTLCIPWPRILAAAAAALPASAISRAKSHGAEEEGGALAAAALDPARRFGPARVTASTRLARRSPAQEEKKVVILGRPGNNVSAWLVGMPNVGKPL